MKTRTSKNFMSYGMTTGNPNSKSAECFSNGPMGIDIVKAK